MAIYHAHRFCDSRIWKGHYGDGLSLLQGCIKLWLKRLSGWRWIDGSTSTYLVPGLGGLLGLSRSIRLPICGFFWVFGFLTAWWPQDSWISYMVAQSSMHEGPQEQGRNFMAFSDGEGKTVFSPAILVDGLEHCKLDWQKTSLIRGKQFINMCITHTHGCTQWWVTQRVVRTWAYI